MFKSSIEYYESWHPHFTVRDSTPVIKAAFKKHPEHLRDEAKIVRWH